MNDVLNKSSKNDIIFEEMKKRILILLSALANLCLLTTPSLFSLLLSSVVFIFVVALVYLELPTIVYSKNRIFNAFSIIMVFVIETFEYQTFLIRGYIIMRLIHLYLIKHIYILLLACVA